MSRYTDTKRIFRDMTSRDLENALVYLRLELQNTENEKNLFQEQIEAAEMVLKERR